MSAKRRQPCVDWQSARPRHPGSCGSCSCSRRPLLAALAAAPASAHTEKQAGRYSFVIGFGTEPAYAGQPNSMQVIISRDGKPATDLGDQLDGLMGHAYYGGKVDPKLENRMMPLEARLRRRLGHAGRLPVVLRAEPGRHLHLRPEGQARQPEGRPGRPQRARPSATSTTRSRRPSRRSRTRPRPSWPSGWTARRPG